MIVLLGPAAAGALADGPVGADPSGNFHVSTLPAVCQSAPAGGACITASVSYLDQARASLGQPAYALPAGFASLAAAQQTLILTDSDRALYGLAQIPGLTDPLDQAAATGVANDADPLPSDSNWYGFTSNWAGGYANMVLAYEAWMYDDGPGSGNVDCSVASPGGCWGHRHDILWQFDGGGSLAMGAAAGTDSLGDRSYAMLLEEASPSSSPTYTYTWNAGGAAAGSVSSATPAAAPTADRPGASAPARSARLTIEVLGLKVRGHRLSIIVGAPGAAYCSMSGLGSRRDHVRRGKACTHRATFAHLPSGRYRLRISSGASTVTRRVVVP